MDEPINYLVVAFLIASAIFVWRVRRRGTKQSTDEGDVTFSSVSGTDATNARRFSSKLTTQQIVDRIKSKEDYKALEREITRVDKKLERATEKNYDSLVDYSNNLQAAETLAAQKTIGWQLIVAESLDVPLEILAHAYNVYVPGDRTIDAKALKREGISWWSPLDPYSEPEKPPKFLEVLIAFRHIVEGGSSLQAKIDAIDELYAKQKRRFGNLLEPAGTLTAGQEWVARELAARGLPKARELVADGVLTVQDVLKITPEQFKERKGVGPASVEKFIKFQEQARKSRS